MYLSLLFWISLATFVSCDFQDNQIKMAATFLKKHSAIKAPQNIICPDGISECYSNSTCCKDNSEGFNCCPQRNAVCCSDGVHCCPQGFTCNLIIKKCIQETFLTSASASKAAPCPGGKACSTFLRKHLAIKAPQNIICPDGTSECYSNNTCCKADSGGYECCPQPNAACCSDGMHCCSQGFTCCSDGLHCCPLGFTCNSILKMCIQESFLTSVSASKAAPCPGGKACGHNRK